MGRKKEISAVNISFLIESAFLPFFLLLLRAPPFPFGELPHLHHMWYWYICQSTVPNSLWSKEWTADPSYTKKLLSSRKLNLLQKPQEGRPLELRHLIAVPYKINPWVPATEISQGPLVPALPQTWLFNSSFWSPSLTIFFQLVPSFCFTWWESVSIVGNNKNTSPNTVRTRLIGRVRTYGPPLDFCCCLKHTHTHTHRPNNAKISG